MALPDWLLTTTCEIRRPFGSGSVLTANISCRVSGEWARGQAAAKDAGTRWTHRMDVNPSVDIRDHVDRNTGENLLVWADGDEVRIPSGGSTRFVVAWVEEVDTGTPEEHLRVYLLRHSR